MARDFRRAREQQEAARIETAKRIRHELQLPTSDRDIEKAAKQRTDAAAQKAVRDAGEG